MPNTPPELAETAGALIVAVEKLGRRVRRSRVQIVALSISIVLDLVLSVGLLFALRGLSRNQDATDAVVARVEKNSGVLYTNCLAANESSDRQHALWEGVLNLTAADPTTLTADEAAAQNRTRAAFLALLEQTYYQRDCNKYKATQ